MTRDSHPGSEGAGLDIRLIEIKNGQVKAW